MRFLRFSSLVIFFIIALSSVTFAQPDRPPDDAPITGIEILIGLGGALGIRKLIVAKRNKPSEK